MRRFSFPLTVLVLILPLSGVQGDSWTAFDVPKVNSGLAEQTLQLHGFHYLSWNNVTVPIGRFDDFQNVLVSGLSDRLEAQDPRWDPFLKILPSFFVGDFGERFYVPDSEASSVATVLKPLAGRQLVVSRPVSQAVRLFGWNWSDWLNAVLFLGGAVAQIWLGRRQKTKIFPLLVWGFAFVLGALGGGPDCIWAFLAWSVVRFRDRRVDPGTFALRARQTLPLLLFSGLAEFMLHFFLKQDIGLSVGSILAGASILLGGLKIEAILFRRRTAKSEHPWFYPLSLRPEPRKKIVWRVTPLGAAVLGTALTLANLGNVSSSFSKSEEGFSKLYWQHCWYQKAVAFDLSWGDYPRPIVLKNFVRTGKSIVEADAVIEVPDKAWRSKVRKDWDSSDVGRLWDGAP